MTAGPDVTAGRDPRDPAEGVPHRPSQLNLLREVKVDSPVHRLWAGTKILAVLGVSVTLSYFPTWGALGVVAVLLLAATLVARIPPGAWPRVPRWFWLVIVVTGTLATVSGGSPHWRVAGTELGLGGLDNYGKFMGVGILLLLAAAVLGWTTPVSDIAPAVAQLLSPLRLVGVPVEEWAAATALAVRSLPMVVDEIRTLVAARRLRPLPDLGRRSELDQWLDGIVDVLVAALSVSVRRAGEMAEAMTARGGTGTIAARTRRPGVADMVALLVVAAACYGATLIPGQ